MYKKMSFQQQLQRQKDAMKTFSQQFKKDVAQTQKRIQKRRKEIQKGDPQMQAVGNKVRGICISMAKGIPDASTLKSISGGSRIGAVSGGVGGAIIGGLAGDKLLDYFADLRKRKSKISRVSRILARIIGAGVGSVGGVALGGGIGAALGGAYAGVKNMFKKQSLTSVAPIRMTYKDALVKAASARNLVKNSVGSSFKIQDK